ncbi:UDP-glucose 4-epimerase family protein [Pseudomonadota bacterium]
MQASRILVTGANGFVGRALSNELVRHGYDVCCAVRSISSATRQSGKLVEVGDIGRKTNWYEAVAGVDTVIHLAARVHVLQDTACDPLAEFRAVNVEGSEKLARDAASAGVRRIVYVSSIGVNGNYTEGIPFTEKDNSAPYDPYTVSKYEAERAIFSVADQTGIEVVVVRPPLVYGPGNPGNFLRLLKMVERGIPLPLASIQNNRSMIYLGNLVDALITTATHAEAGGKTYLVSDDEDISIPELIRQIACLMGRQPRLWAIPLKVLRIAGQVAGKSSELEKLVGSLVINSSKIRADLGWSTPYTFDEGLAETVKWFQSISGKHQAP